jgi:hypothetical protein
LWEMNRITDGRNSFTSVRISARVDAACNTGTNASQSFGGPNVSKFAVSPAERAIDDARTRVLVITAPPAEKYALIYPGRAGATGCE